jgi:hypothetical protein
MRLFWTSLLLVVCGSALAAQPPVTIDRKAIGAIAQPIRVVGHEKTHVPLQTDSRITIARNELLVARTGDRSVERTVDGRQRFELPITMIGVGPKGGVLNLAAVVEVAGGGFRLRRDAGGYEGQIFVGIEDKDNPAGRPLLGRKVQFLVTADADSVKPDTLEIGHANLPYKPVVIETTRPGDAVTVRIRPDFDQKAFEIALKITRPQLTIAAMPPSVQGLGLETTDLRVSVVGAVVPEGVPVSVTADGGRLSSTDPVLSAGGTATTSLRSVGLGKATVRASHPFFEPSTPEEVTFLFPWAFAIAVTLGGAIGGVLRYGIPKRRKGKRVDVRPLLWHGVFGVLTGLVVAAAYAVGINLLNVEPSATAGEALVFVLAALGALISTGRLTRIIVAEPQESEATLA